MGEKTVEVKQVNHGLNGLKQSADELLKMANEAGFDEVFVSKVLDHKSYICAIQNVLCGGES